MKRLITLLTIALFALAMLAGPAAAHHLTVNPPGGGEGPEEEAWVGGPVGLPGQGQGLNHEGGPSQNETMTPAHDKGLVTACENLRDHGNSAVDIFGPAAPDVDTTCRHGGL